MGNILENWKKECYVLSSPLSINRQLERDDVDGVVKVFEEYFGLNYFNIESPEKAIKSDQNWIIFLLVNHNRPACIAALYEIANILKYLKTLTPSIQNKFKSLFQDPHQFRNMFFELYVYRLLDYNNISNNKKIKEGIKELEGTCFIAEKEYLFECKKLYAPEINLYNVVVYAMELLYIKFNNLNKGFGLIGTIKFKDYNNLNTRDVFTTKLLKFFNGFNEQTFHNIDYQDSDSLVELSVVNYTPEVNIEIDQNFNKYHVIFKIIPPYSPTPGILNHYAVDLKCNFSFTQEKVTRKLLSSINDKKNQHNNSKYPNKIYFIDSETIPDFTLPIFRTDSMFEEDKIKTFLESFSENEIVCFIRREYMDDVPNISIKCYGKNIDSRVQRILEGLKTNFDFNIKVSYKKPIVPLSPYKGKFKIK
jgi:hypothetical protein